MTEIQELANLLHAASPELELNLDCPGEPGAPCWLDVSSHDHFVAVEWRPALGFGVSRVDTASAPRAGLFEGPDEVLQDIHSTKERILALLGLAGARANRRVAAGR